MTWEKLILGDTTLSSVVQSYRDAYAANLEIKGPRPWVDVRSKGAKGDGVTDDTTALQDSINEVPAGGRLFVPYTANYYKFSTLTIDHPMTIAGMGWNMSQNSAPFGGANWNTAVGSVMRSTATTGNAILLGKTGENTFQYNLENLAIVGPGSGTTTGILFGPAGTDGSTRSHWSNVLVGNFNTGLTMNAVENSGFFDLRIGGCTNGLTIPSTSFAANWFIGLDVQSCLTVGVDWQVGASGTTILGGLFAGNGVDSVKMSGTGNRILSCWFENASATGDDIKITDATNCLAAYNINFKRPIRVTGASSGTNYVLNNDGNVGTIPDLIIAANVPVNTVVRGNKTFTITDNSGKMVVIEGRRTGATSVADGGTIAHGLDVTPAKVRVTPTVASQMTSVTAISSTTFTVAIKTDAGAAGTTQTVYWEAEA